MSDPNELLRKASTEKSRWSLFNSTKKYITAAELYSEAGSLFVKQGKHNDAGNAYILAAEAYSTAEESTETLYYYIQAGTCFEHSNPEKAAEIFSLVKAVYIKKSDFYNVAKYTLKMAEVMKDTKPEEAIVLFNEAIDYYKFNNNNIHSIYKCKLEIATLEVTLLHYENAAKIFESLANEHLEHNLLHHKCPELYTNAIICWLATGQFDLASEKLILYKNSYPSATQFKYLTPIVDSCLKCVLREFTDNLINFDKIKPFNEWQCKALQTVKDSIKDRSDNIL
jgi:tetratricopeptide (TPR) repeat protein